MSTHSPNGSSPPGPEDASGPEAGGRKTRITQSPIQLQPGTVLIGTYEITEHINTGGMGEVYRGINIHNDEVVAIKIVLPALAHDAKILSLFQKESTVLRRIAHDAIVRYEVFTIDPGIARPCLVMEFVEGVSLGDHMETGPMPEAQVLALLRRLADGLQVAHRAGVVHRDLSPDNVVLCGGEVESAKIIDFGIAKETTPGGGTLIGGQFAGKPGYVAPEQLGLYESHVTGKSDIYSLGLLAAAAAQGYPIDMGDNPADAVRARMSVPDLSALPDRLRPLVTWMLQPDPADRPEDMGAVVHAIAQTSLPPEAQTAPPQTFPPQSSPPQSLPPQTFPPNTSQSPHGLSVPPIPGTSAPGMSVHPTSAAPEGGSPFGPPPSTPPGDPGPGGDRAAKGRSRLRGPVLLLMLLALAGGGAWYAGLLPQAATWLPQATAWLPGSAPDLAAQRAWLASRTGAQTGGTCRYLQPDPGPTSGAPSGDSVPVAGFARSPEGFADLRTTFAEAHGAPLDLQVTEVSEAQCSALDFLSGLGPAITEGPALSLRVTGSGDDPEGRLNGQTGEAVALLLIDPAGRVQNITGEIDTATGRFELPSRRLRRAQTSGADADAAFLLLGLSSAEPLGTVALIPPNAILPFGQVAQFWQFLSSDIDATQDGVRAALAAIRP